VSVGPLHGWERPRQGAGQPRESHRRVSVRRPRGVATLKLHQVASTLGRWIAAGALEQPEVEDALYAAAVANGLVADDGERQCWATIRSGLGAGLREPVELGTSG
jgi:hypothetical protein